MTEINKNINEFKLNSGYCSKREQPEKLKCNNDTKDTNAPTDLNNDPKACVGRSLLSVHLPNDLNDIEIPDEIRQDTQYFIENPELCEFQNDIFEKLCENKSYEQALFLTDCIMDDIKAEF